MGSSNDKAMKILIFVFAAFTLAFFVFTQNYENKSNENTSNSNSNEIEKEEVKKIGDINNIELYVTNYVYNKNIPGYSYTKVELLSDSVNVLKEKIKDIELDEIRDKMIYGKYKLVLDNITLFFDLGNDYALYSNENIVIKFPNTLKELIAKSNDTCSCCTTEGCKINLCSCSN